MTNQDFASQLQNAIAAFHPRMEARGAAYVLRLPGFDDMPWRAPLKKSLFGRANPNLVFYEEAATAAMAFFFKTVPVKVLFDLGAQNGYYTSLALHYQAHPIDAYAFEMNPLVTPTLQQTVDAAPRRGHGEVVLAGLSDTHVGEHDIWVSVTKMFEAPPQEKDFRDPWYTRIKMRLRGRADRERPTRHRVEITSIDYFCATRGVTPDLMKIDVDGYEAKVLPGALETIRAHRPVIFLELHKKKFIERFAVTRAQIVAPLFAMGYRAVLLDNHHSAGTAVVPIEPDNAIVGRESTDLFIFYPPERLAIA